MLALAQPRRVLTVAVTTAIVWARVAAAVFAFPSVRTCAVSCGVVAKTMPRTIIGANELRAVIPHEPAVAFACVVVLHALAVPRASVGASEVGAILQQVPRIARAEALETRPVPTARVGALTNIACIAFPARLAAA